MYAQAPPDAPPEVKAEQKDPLGRSSPQASVIHFLEACHARDYTKAAHYLDLRQMPPADRAKAGPDLALQLEDLLDDTPFDIATLSRDLLGDLEDDLEENLEELDTFRPDGHDVVLQLDRPAETGAARLAGFCPKRGTDH